jgi:hypothetical protein
MNQPIFDLWIEAKRQLDFYKKIELAHRALITTAVLAGQLRGSKTTYFAGHKVTATARLNYKIDEAELSINWKDLTPEEKACIEYKPRLKETLYHKLPDNSILKKAVVTVTPGTAGLEVKE